MAIFKPPAGWRLNEIKGTHFEPLIILEVCLGSEVAVCWNVCMYDIVCANMCVQCTCVYKEDMWDAPDLKLQMRSDTTQQINALEQHTGLDCKQSL